MADIARGDTGRGRWFPGWLRSPGWEDVEQRYEWERALHDGPAAGLSALAIELDLISSAAGDSRQAARIDAAREAICQLVDRLRRVSATLHPALLADGLEPTWVSVAERCDLRLRVGLPRHELDAQASARTALLVADHLRTLEPGTTVWVRVRGRRFVRVQIIEQRPGSASRRRFLAVLRCG